MGKGISIVQQAKELKRGDVITYDPSTRILHAYRPIGVEKIPILTTPCYLIETRKHFLDVAQLFGGVAASQLRSTAGVKESQSVWSIEFV